MIQLLLILGDNEYAKAVILHVRALMYHEENRDLPFRDMFENDVGTFSEEAGEIAISVTARYTLGDHTNDKLGHANKMFQSIGLYHTLCAADGQLRDENCSKHELPDLQRTLDSTTEYFRSLLRSLQAGTWVYYENAHAYEVNGHAHRLHREPPAAVWRDVRPEFAKRLANIDRTFPRHWGAQYADIMEFVLPERGQIEQRRDQSESNMDDDANEADMQDYASGESLHSAISEQPLRQQRMSRSRSPNRDHVSLQSASTERPVRDLSPNYQINEPNTTGMTSRRRHVGNTPNGAQDAVAAARGGSRSSHSFEVGSSYETAYVQTALRGRPRRGRLRRPADRGPFIESPPL